MDEQRAEFEAFVLQETGISLRGNVEAMTPGIGLAWRAWQAATQRQQERIAELEAQVQALSLDAGRYRFIRDNCNRRINIEIDNAGMEISDTVDASIDAAPDLLEALQSIVKLLTDQDDEGLIERAEPMIRARAAIARATHKEQA